MHQQPHDTPSIVDLPALELLASRGEMFDELGDITVESEGIGRE